MPQPIADNILSTPISGSIVAGGKALAIEGSGRDFANNYSGLDWYSSITPDDGRYVIISQSIGVNLPTHWITADSTDAELLYTVNRLPSVANQQTFTDTGSALSYLAQNEYMVLRSTPDQSDADNIVMNWDASNLSSYPRQDNTWYDVSGIGRYGTLTNSPSFDGNKSIVFDGVDDFVLLSSSYVFGNGNWTLNMLINADSFINYNLMSNSSGGPVTNAFGAYSSNIYYQNYDGVWNPHSGNTTLATKRWYMLSWVNYDNSEMEMFVNGNLDSPRFNSFTTNGGPCNVIGKRYSGTTYDGKISNVTIYNKSLSSEELKQNYFGGPIVTDGLILSSDASNLVSYENGSTTTYSLTGSYSGSLFNGTGFEDYNGGIWSFDGGDDHIRYQLGALNSVYTNNSITMQSWLKYDFNAQYRNGIFSFYNGQASSFAFGWRFSGGNALFWDTHIDGIRYNHELIPTGQWNTYRNKWINIATTWEDGGFTSYLNGKQVAQTSVNGQINDFRNENLFIGNQGGYGYFLGKVATLLAYDRALTADEVAQNYNASKQKYQS